MPMRLGTEMPQLDGATQWFHTDGVPQLENGKVTLVHFWAVTCHICHETMEDVIDMIHRYEAEGLQAVGMHMPRFEEEANVDKVKTDMETYHMEHPIGLDHMLKVAGEFQNEYVPAFFVFDREGNLKFRAAGDKGFLKVEPKIREALGLDS